MLPATCPHGPRVPPKLHHCLLSVTFAPLCKAGVVRAVPGMEVAWPQLPYASLLCTEASEKVRPDP